MKITKYLSLLVNPRSETKLSEIFNRIAAPAPLSRRKQTDQAALRRKSLSCPVHELTRYTPRLHGTR